jgi:hypothetical protein
MDSRLCQPCITRLAPGGGEGQSACCASVQVECLSIFNLSPKIHIHIPKYPGANQLIALILKRGPYFHFGQNQNEI